ncbi:MAG: hypothetical protein WDO14_06270 [Bacteroidota bacterium]
MEDQDPIPVQHTGEHSDIEERIESSTLRQAHSTFVEAARRLLNINEWRDLSGPLSASFMHADSNGRKLDRVPKPGDLIRINIPGPGTATGEGYDWVRIETIEDKPNPAGNEELFLIRVRPVSSPLNNEHDIAHFFDDTATSTFMIERKGLVVTASVHGRNEQPNKDVERPIDKMRNEVVANLATSGVATRQWTMLTKGILKDL